MLPSSSERVCCNLKFAFDESNGEGYYVSGRDKAGLEIFRLSLAATMIEPAVLVHAQVTPIMHPDGTIQLIADGLSFDRPIGLSTNVQDLIVQAVDEKMLEDEPDAEVMLQTLRKRLLSSLASVDGAISDFGKHQKP